LDLDLLRARIGDVPLARISDDRLGLELEPSGRGNKPITPVSTDRRRYAGLDSAAVNSIREVSTSERSQCSLKLVCSRRKFADETDERRGPDRLRDERHALDRQDARDCCLAPFGRADGRDRGEAPAAGSSGARTRPMRSAMLRSLPRPTWWFLSRLPDRSTTACPLVG
jgi:hypothetical protein